jgi:hypothetical protein
MKHDAKLDPGQKLDGASNQWRLSYVFDWITNPGWTNSPV